MLLLSLLLLEKAELPTQPTQLRLVPICRDLCSISKNLLLVLLRHHVIDLLLLLQLLLLQLLAELPLLQLLLLQLLLLLLQVQHQSGCHEWRCRDLDSLSD